MEFVNLSCQNCLWSFNKPKSEYEYSKNRGQNDFFCNLSCAISFSRKRQTEKAKLEYNKNPRRCKYCNDSISFEDRHVKKIYCSRDCSFQDNKEVIKTNATKHGRYALKPCKICKTPTKHKCCSKVCESENDKQIRVNKLKDGKYSSKPYSGRTTLKKALVDIRGKACECCKNYMWMDLPINLTIDHIDGNASNNKLDNLKLLCWNCHSMTPTFGRKNKVSARNYRYKKELTLTEIAV